MAGGLRYGWSLGGGSRGGSPGSRDRAVPGEGDSWSGRSLDAEVRRRKEKEEIIRLRRIEV